MDILVHTLKDYCNFHVAGKLVLLNAHSTQVPVHAIYELFTATVATSVGVGAVKAKALGEYFYC